MTKNITTVTHPDGVVSKRTSERATYTYAVVIEPGSPQAIAAGHRANARQALATAESLRAAAATGKVTRRDRRFRSTDPDTFHAFDYNLAGTKVRGQKGHAYYSISVRGNSAGTSVTFPEYLHSSIQVIPGTETVEYGSNMGQVNAGQFAIGTALQRAEALEEAAAKSEQAAVAAEQGEGLGGYGVLRWSSRRDLAEKAASGEFSGLAASGRKVRVVPVDEK